MEGLGLEEKEFGNETVVEGKDSTRSSLMNIYPNI